MNFRKALFYTTALSYFLLSCAATRSFPEKTQEDSRNILYLTTEEIGKPSEQWEKALERIGDDIELDLDNFKKEYTRAFYRIYINDNKKSTSTNSEFDPPIDYYKDNILEIEAYDAKEVLDEIKGIGDIDGMIDYIFIKIHGKDHSFRINETGEYITISDLDKSLTQEDKNKIRKKFSKNARCFMNVCYSLEDYKNKDTIGEYMMNLFGIPMTGALIGSYERTPTVWHKEDNGIKKIVRIDPDFRELFSDFATIYPDK